MILAMMIGYIVILHLIFNVFKFVTPSTRNKIYVTVVGCFMIYCVLLVINVYQPMSTDLRVYRFVTPLRPRVSGVVSDVVATPNTPLKKGDTIMQIDPAQYQAAVARLEAALVEAEQQAKMLPLNLAAKQAAVEKAGALLVEAKQNAESLDANVEAAEAGVAKSKAQLQLAQTEFDRQKTLMDRKATSQDDVDKAQMNHAAAIASLTQASANLDSARLAADSKIDGLNTGVLRAQEALRESETAEATARLAVESEINGENTTVARIRAELAAAKLDLKDTVVSAPADGHVTNVTLRPGQFIRPQDTAVITFVPANEYAIAATFHQEVINRIQPGDMAEIAMDDLPGRTLAAKVKNVNFGIPQGQFAASGTLADPQPIPHGRFFVQFTLDDDQGLILPAGEAGAATVYTSKGQTWIPVRKVFFRWYTWLNYILTDMDVKGPRQ